MKASYAKHVIKIALSDAIDTLTSGEDVVSTKFHSPEAQLLYNFEKGHFIVRYMGRSNFIRSEHASSNTQT